MVRWVAKTCRWCPRPRLRRLRRSPIRRPTCAATMSSRCRSATRPRSTPSSRNTRTASMRASPSCRSADADGNWNSTSQRSLTLFNRYAKTKFDTKLASTDALDAIKTKTARVCPLVCDHGYKVDGDACVKITCAEGTFLNDDNQCEKRRDKKPVATRERPDP